MTALPYAVSALRPDGATLLRAGGNAPAADPLQVSEMGLVRRIGPRSLGVCFRDDCFDG
jgi:methylmalonyl-CoA mutase cobalamin-binding subunit